ncbi:uncharacterized protein N7459_001677 [Penicillium hispanicum]|uniref:uncharacterized protein n=1 Tax=Penicillium hispanicum TaxID=1080232 RepID=UPI002540A98C|nr:uncharacterized protein N7459_001677 [Penicillium hispanicum]KAJ5595469.1 hypothetical protein N7459_001677 [Penicillium hispanicum]
MAKDELRIFTPIGMLGYGFSEQIFWSTMAEGVDAVILDAGSTDSGPSKLALGKSTGTRQAYERDLGVLVAGCHVYRKPLLIGSAGGDGSTRGVDMFVDIIQEAIRREGYRPMKVVSIEAEISKSVVRDHYERSLVKPCGSAVPELEPRDIDDATRIVAQMGIEPWLKAMEEHPDFDIIVGGRSYDPSPYAAFCLSHGITDLGVAYHMGKIMECGALCSVPKSREALAIVRNDSFDIRALDLRSRCTAVSVASHTLYEKTRPDILTGPGGDLHLEDTQYEELPDGRTVRVRGARFAPVEEGGYTIKLEAGRQDGYHSMFIGGFTDRILINQIDDFFSRAKLAVREACHFPFELEFRVYGRDGTAVCGRGIGGSTPVIMPDEIGICAHAKAATQEDATHVAHTARVFCMHASYPIQRATAGNFAMPFAPFDIPLGPVCEFCIYHTMVVNDPTEYFTIRETLLHGENTAASTAPDMERRATGTGSHIKEPASATEKKDLLAGTSASHPTANQSVSVLGDLTPAAGHIFLADLAKVVRSKNAGPYEITLDVMFHDAETVAKVKESNILTPTTIANLYDVPESDVIACLWWHPALAFKVTLKRPMVSGGFWDRDAHGSAQHMPLMTLQIPTQV